MLIEDLPAGRVFSIGEKRYYKKHEHMIAFAYYCKFMGEADSIDRVDGRTALIMPGTEVEPATIVFSKG